MAHRRCAECCCLINAEAIRKHVPADALRAIVAHELAHIDYYQSESRMGLAGLLRLISPTFTARFERKADMQAIALGYGPGLAQYRIWLYRNIPASAMPEKKRDYFSPEEIAGILQAESQRAGAMKAFLRCAPRNLAEIRALAKNPAMACPD